ncbi:putative transposase, Ptta/En/Spm, plant [Helianthus debilis subsp. tardiflorus]
MCQKNMHTAGPKSFARIHEEMKNDDPNQELPTLTQLFEQTRKRTEGHVYVDTYDDTARKIEQMKNYKPTEDDNATVDPFLVVMNKENYGYRRLYGRGVTNTLVKKVDGACISYMIPEGLMESFKANIEVEKNQLLEMRKEIEEDHERKKAELEAMQKDIDSQRQNLEAMMQKVMKRLPVGDRHSRMFQFVFIIVLKLCVDHFVI